MLFPGVLLDILFAEAIIGAGIAPAGWTLVL